MTTTSETPTRRVRVHLDPVGAALGLKPWRAVIVERGHNLADDPSLEPGEREIPVGRFDGQPEAVTTACSALRFVNAGISWQPVGIEQTEVPR
jgi:hypothetical protein